MFLITYYITIVPYPSPIVLKFYLLIIYYKTFVL
jgi:hypothetical protein